MLFRIIYSYVSRPNRSYVLASSSLFRANCENIKTFKKNARRRAGGQVEKPYLPPFAKRVCFLNSVKGAFIKAQKTRLYKASPLTPPKKR